MTARAQRRTPFLYGERNATRVGRSCNSEEVRRYGATGTPSPATSETRTPLLGVLRAVKNRINGDAILCGFVKNLERESPNERPPELVHHNRVQVGMSLHPQHASFDTSQELFPEPWLPCFVPLVSGHYILLSLGHIKHTLNHVEFRARSFT
jgi:hypothetical protein